MLKNGILEAPWGYFRTQKLKMLKNSILETPWGYFRVQGLKMLIGTQTKSELRQNRNSDKIGTHRKFKRTWEKKSFRLSPYIYNK